MTNDEAWAAGYLSASGTLFLSHQNGKSTIWLTVKSTLREDSVNRLGQIIGCNVRDSSQGRKLTITGEPLHQFMRRVWDGLSRSRQLEYAKLRKEAHALV